MKLIIKLLIFIACSSCADHTGNKLQYSKSENNEDTLVVSATLLATYSNYSNQRDRNFYYLIEVKLTNYTNEVCKFFTLSCGSLVNIITDSRQSTFLYHNCESDFATLIELKPKQEYIINAILVRDRYARGFTPYGRIGFIIDEPKKKFGKYVEMTNHAIVTELKLMRQNQTNVIWSDPIALTSTNFYPYKINDLIKDSSFYTQQ